MNIMKGVVHYQKIYYFEIFMNAKIDFEFYLNFVYSFSLL